uniref:Uncharacterized protein n=1 Tax=Arundo donax TaxID=35708 RepID=A0A0A9A013_ARUDO
MMAKLSSPKIINVKSLVVEFFYTKAKKLDPRYNDQDPSLKDLLRDVDQYDLYQDQDQDHLLTIMKRFYPNAFAMQMFLHLLYLNPYMSKCEQPKLYQRQANITVLLQ